MTRSERLERRLQQYHDGELSILGRWRVERRLARDPAARRQLHLLRAIGETLRDAEPEPASPDLWPAIAAALPQRRPARVATGAAAWLPALTAGYRPLAAGLAAAALVFAVLLVSWPQEPEVNRVVRWLDSGGKPVMVLPGGEDSTIIWVLDTPAEDEGGGRSRGVG